MTEPGAVKVTVKYAALENWKERRADMRVEAHWMRIVGLRELSSFERYQRDWNFIEAEYGERPSNNGLDLGNPAFAFTTNLAKFLKFKEMVLLPAGRKALSDETIERKGAPPSSTQNIERNGCNKTGETT